MLRRPLIPFALAALLVTAGCIGLSQSHPSAEAEPTPTAPTHAAQNRTIHVDGAGSASTPPDQAVVSVAVVARADDATTARRQMAENASRMRAALTELGLDESQITTRRYDIGRYRRPVRGSENDRPQLEYRAVHDFRITLSDIDRVGTVIDTAVQNGASEVDNVEFTISRERRRTLERRSRDAAMSDARQKASQLATDANLTITGVKTVRADGGAPRPARYTAAATPEPTPTAGAPSELNSGSITTTVRVTVVYTAAPTDESTAHDGS